MKNNTIKRKYIYTAGFTLIELIIVLGIIALFVQIVLPRIDTARLRSKRASVQTSLWSYRTQAQSYFNANQKFGTNTSAVSTCPLPGVSSNTFLDDLSSQMVSFSEISKAVFSCYIPAGGESYAMYATIPGEINPNALTFCIDSSGYFDFRAIPNISDSLCN